MHSLLHLNLDDAWEGAALNFPTIEARAWGPVLRFSAQPRLIEEFFREHQARLPPFLLYGSGDFHHLSALWIRRITAPLIVVSFDNHPDWDIRPPRWCCGSWVNRALDLPHVEKVCVWGCGNFESWWPGQIFGNRRAEREGQLDVHPWADERPVAQQKRRGAIFRETWRAEFERFVAAMSGANLYVTVDLDCLQPGDAVTNWENGKFTLEDVAWGLARLQAETRIVGGDICGAYSKANYARATQRLIAMIDHPRLPIPDEGEARKINRTALERLVPILTSA